jgi:hypothetical protein
LRLYAGKHDGRFPVTEVPRPPLDVITGKPFVYSCTGDVARLTQPDEFHGNHREMVYEITIARPKRSRKPRVAAQARSNTELCTTTQVSPTCPTSV